MTNINYSLIEAAIYTMSNSCSIKRELTYTQHLQSIAKIKFTFREIDIIACILHNRGEKKIGSLLGISHRTVGTHMRNIMAKIGHNSRDGIIDFVEKSGKLSYIRTYYAQLALRAIFDQMLQKVATLINRQPLNCGIFYDNLSNNDHEQVKNLISDLKQANINAHINAAQIRNLYVITDQPKLIARNQTDLNLVIDDQVNLSLYNDHQYIDFTTNSDYYLAMMRLIEQLTDHQNIQDLVTQFTEDYNALKAAQLENKTDIEEQRNILFSGKYTKYVIATSFVLLVILIVYLGKNRQSSVTLKPDYNVARINNALADYVDHFSADNITHSQISQNHDLSQTLEKIVNYDDVDDVRRYFADTALSSNYLMNYLYNLQALSSYYMNNNHNGKKASEILLYAKNLMENYVNSRSNISNNFDDLDPEELLSELRIIDNLPEIYTRIIYSLARSYIYRRNQLDSLVVGQKYFEISKYLGNKLRLLEGYLSDASGLLIIKKIQSEQASQDVRDKMLREIITGYTELNDGYDGSTIYVKDFAPNGKLQEKVDIRLNPYSVFDRFFRMVTCYGELLQLDQTEDSNQVIITSLIDTIHNTNTISNFADILKEIPQKKFADFCNNLGIIYATLYRKNIQSPILNQEINYIFKIKAQNNYSIAEELFTKAKILSRNNDFTKADAYHGLVRLYQYYIENNQPLDRASLPPILTKIKELSKKRDIINQALGR